MYTHVHLHTHVWWCVDVVKTNILCLVRCVRQDSEDLGRSKLWRRYHFDRNITRGGNMATASPTTAAAGNLKIPLDNQSVEESVSCVLKLYFSYVYCTRCATKHWYISFKRSRRRLTSYMRLLLALWLLDQQQLVADSFDVTNIQQCIYHCIIQSHYYNLCML